MSSGSSRRAAASRSGVASVPRLETNASWARSRSIRARWSSSSGPASRRGQQAASRRERAGLDAGLSGRERAFTAPRRVRGQRGGALQEGRRRGDPTAGLRAAGRTLELGGDVLVRSRCRQRAVPRAAIGVGVRIAHLGEGFVHPLSAAERRGPVDRRAHQRMAELDARADLQQLREPRRARARRARCRASGPRAGPAPGHPGARRPPAASDAASPRAARGRAAGSGPRCVPGARRRREARSRRPARRRSCAPGSSSSASGLPRVSATIRSRTRPSSRPVTTLASSARASCSGSPPRRSSGRPSKSCSASRVAHGDHDRHRLGPHPSRDEAEDLARGGIQPLRVLDEAEQRPLLRHGGQQAEHGQPDQEPVRHLTRRRAQGNAQGVPLRRAGARRAGPSIVAQS